MANMENKDYRKTVSFATGTDTSNKYQPRNYNTSNTQNYANSQYNSLNYRPSTTFSNFNQVNLTSTSQHVRPSTVNTTYNLGSSQVFNNPSYIFASNSIMGRNPSVVVKPESLIKIEIYSPNLNGTLNRHYSARLACFIRSLNTLRASDNSLNENSFVNGGVWAKRYQNRDTVTVVINGIHIVETFPLTIFNEDPNWNYHNEIKNYRKTFIDTISQFSDCNFLQKVQI